jgi:plastocyanin
MSASRRRRHQRRTTPWLWVAGLVALLALGGVLLLPIGDPGPSGDQEPLPVSMVEFAFVPSGIVVDAGQPLSITNDGAVRHNLLVTRLGKGIELAPGQTGTLELPSDAAGTYDVVCDLPGHREAGMVGTLTVGEGRVEEDSGTTVP